MNLILAENHSLKGKRSVLRTIQAKVTGKFNVSVTECGEQDKWQSAVLGFGAVGSDSRIVEATLQRVIAFVDAMRLAELRGTDVEVFHC